MCASPNSWGTTVNLGTSDAINNWINFVLYACGAVAAMIAYFRSRAKSRDQAKPKLPGDTFAGDAQVAPNPELVDARQAVSLMQKQLNTSFEQNRMLQQRVNESEMIQGAQRRYIRALEDAWPEAEPRPHVDPHDAAILRSLVNDDTAPPTPHRRHR